MAGFGTPLRAGQVLPQGRLQRMQQGAFIETSSQGLFTGEILSNGGTNPSPNDFDTCRWFRTGHLGTVYWTAVFPAGFSAGSNIYLFTMPFPPDPEYFRMGGTSDDGHRPGEGKLRDDDTNSDSEVTVAQFFNDNDQRTIFLSVSGANGAVNASLPIPWAADDAIQFRARYPVDPRILP